MAKKAKTTRVSKPKAAFSLPTTVEGIGLALKLLEGQYVEFGYENQLETPQSPSAVAARAATVYAAEDKGTAKGFLYQGSLFYAKTTGHLCVRMRDICRRDGWKLWVNNGDKWVAIDSLTKVDGRFVTCKADARMHFLARCPRLRRHAEGEAGGMWKVTGGEYQFRTFRLCGIKVRTLKCGMGSTGKVPVFPCGVGVAEVR